jgi:hypothetical protein
MRSFLATLLNAAPNLVPNLSQQTRDLAMLPVIGIHVIKKMS